MATTIDRSASVVADDTIAGTPAGQDHPLAQAGDEAGQTAGRLAERTAGIGMGQADRMREQAADGLRQLATVVRRSGGDLESEQPAIANVANTAADQAERIAGYLRETDARELVRTVEDVARRQPLLFIGGAFLLGVAASRFVRAGGPQQPAGMDGSMSTTARRSIDQAGGASARAGTDIDGYRATGPGATGTGIGSMPETAEGLGS